MVEKVVTSFRIDPNLLKQAKIHCIQEDVSFGDLLEQLLIERLKKKKG